MERRGIHVWNMLMKAVLNDCLLMHVRTNAGLWICDHLNVACWCNAVFSHLGWIYLWILHKTCTAFQIMMHIFDPLIPGPVIRTAAQWLVLSSTTIWKAVSTIYDLMMSMPKKQSASSVQLGDLKCDQSFPRQLYWSSSSCDNYSQFPSQVHWATLTVSQRREDFFQCQTKTLCKEQDFINNPFKVKCLPLQF